MTAHTRSPQAEADDKLLESALAGDTQAIEDLAVRTSKIVHFFARLKAKDSAGLRWLNSSDIDDLSQIILIALFKDNLAALRKFRGQCTYEHWIAIVVVNRLIDKKRSAAQRAEERSQSIFQAKSYNDPDGPTTLDDLPPDLAADPQEQMLYRCMIETVREAREAVLSTEEQLIIDVWCSNEYTLKEMAELLRTNENTIATKIRRAKGKITQYLNERDDESVI